MYERMLDKQRQPTPAKMADYCGEQAKAFLCLNDWLSQCHGTQQKVGFPYGNGYGWGVAHRKKQKLICHVFVEAGAFTVMLRLSRAQFAAVYDDLQPYARDYVDHAYPCGDGGWVHYRVSAPNQEADIRRMLAVKCGGK